MKDNWKGKGGYEFEAMEGGGPKGCTKSFIIICFVPIASVGGIVWWFL